MAGYGFEDGGLIAGGCKKGQLPGLYHCQLLILPGRGLHHGDGLRLLCLLGNRGLGRLGFRGSLGFRNGGRCGRRGCLRFRGIVPGNCHSCLRYRFLCRCFGRRRGMALYPQGQGHFQDLVYHSLVNFPALLNPADQRCILAAAIKARLSGDPIGLCQLMAQIRCRGGKVRQLRHGLHGPHANDGFQVVLGFQQLQLQFFHFQPFPFQIQAGQGGVKGHHGVPFFHRIPFLHQNFRHRLGVA